MRLAAALIGLSLALTGGSAAAQTTDYTYKPNSVFGGSDVRVKADSRVYPWTAVGRFNRAGRGHCTATVVAPRIVATAAHCLADKNTGGYMPADSLHFVAGWDRGEYIFHSVAVELHPAPGYKPMGRPTLGAVVHDWALIVLEKDPIPITGVLEADDFTEDLFWQLYAAKTIFTQAGYSGDRGHVLTAHPACKLWGFAKGRAIVEHGCQAVPGDSGSPVIYSPGNGKYVLAAVHVAHTKNRVGGKGFAVPSSSFLKTLRALQAKLNR